MIKVSTSLFLSLLAVCTCTLSAAAQDDQTVPDPQVIADSLNALITAVRQAPEPDPSVGIAFIKYVTETGVSSQHERASQIYNWGFGGSNVADHKQALEDELARMQPILSERKHRDLQRMLKRDDPELLSEISNFWKSLDPTPSTPYNERLVEHWRRIAYSKKYFNRDDDNIFEADDRAYTYVEFGQPEQIVRNVLLVSMGEIIAAARQLAASDYGRQQAEFVSQQAFNYHENVPYEVWVYDRPSIRREGSLVRMFSTKPESGFGEVKVLEDLIPDRAFAISKRNNISGFDEEFRVMFYNPGMLLQWIYYNKFSTVDQHYARLFSELDQAYTAIVAGTNRGARDQSTALRYRATNRHETERINNFAPDEMSTDAKILDKIGSKMYEYRFLDEDGRPYSRLFVESDPRKIFLEDLSLNQDYMLQNMELLPGENARNALLDWYEFSHRLMIRDEEGNVIKDEVINPRLVIDDSRYEEQTTSVFRAPIPDENLKTEVITVLKNNHPATQPKEATSYNPAFRSRSVRAFDLQKPLDPSEGEMIISDLVLGFRDDSSAVMNLEFPFVVSNEKEIFEGDNLFVHFEAYNLRANDEDLYDLQLQYSISSPEAGLLSAADTDDLEVTLNFASDVDRILENIEIQSNRLVPGKYEMTFTFTDPNAGISRSRSIPFTIIYPETDQ